MTFISQPVNCCHFSRQPCKIVLRPFMSVLIILIAVSLLVAISFLAAFFGLSGAGNMMTIMLRECVCCLKTKPSLKTNQLQLIINNI